jgi:hypothetical protein
MIGVVAVVLIADQTTRKKNDINNSLYIPRQIGIPVQVFVYR